MSKIAIIGAGSLGKIVTDIFASRGQIDDVEGFYDDNKDGEYYNFNIIGNINDIDPMQRKVIAIGDINTRKQIYERYEQHDMMFEVAFHRHITLSNSSDNAIGVGTIIKGGAVLEPHMQIGINCIIGNNVTICHDSVIGNHSRISPGVTICGNVDIGDEVYLCPGVTVSKDIRIDSKTTVASGVTVYNDIIRDNLDDRQTIFQSDIE